MKMQTTLLALGLLCCGLCSTVSAALVTSFDGTGLDGWTLNSAGGTLTPFADVEGTGVAGIQLTDTSNGPSLYVSPWTGDQSAQIGEALEYGLVWVRPATTAVWIPSTMDVIINSGTTTISANLSYDDVEPALGVVLNQSVLLDAATFGTDAATFAAVMGNVDSLELRAEHWDANGIEGYLTNTAVPEPNSIVLLSTLGLGMLARHRRRPRSI